MLCERPPLGLVVVESPLVMVEVSLPDVDKVEVDVAVVLELIAVLPDVVELTLALEDERDELCDAEELEAVPLVLSELDELLSELAELVGLLVAELVGEEVLSVIVIVALVELGVEEAEVELEELVMDVEPGVVVSEVVRLEVVLDVVSLLELEEL